LAAIATVTSTVLSTPTSGTEIRENRGVLSSPASGGNFVGWQLLLGDPPTTGFHVYRDGVRVTPAPVHGRTNYLDAGASPDAQYTVAPVVDGVESARSQPSLRFTADRAASTMDIPIQVPPDGTTPSGERYSYSANDASVGDLDGDGQYEIVLKWDPSNAKDNSQSGYTGNIFLDAYRLDGTRLWRIDLGRNIRAGAHYTQFQVFDYDGDGRAEVAMKAADGTVSGTGQVIGNGSADHRNSSGYVLAGPEFLTVFDGRTGAALATADFVPPRGNVADWGDSYGNRVDRFLAGTAYVDGARPSIVMARGYYTRSVVSAWDWRDGRLTRRWTFDSRSSTNGPQWEGQGNHNLSVSDVDSDGRDEIVYGAMTIDDDGTGRYSTRLGHGDALHVGDLIPGRPGLEVFGIHESNPVGSDVHDARTGSVIWSKPNNTGSEGPGRGVAGDIYPGSPGAEFWSVGGGAPDALLDGSGRSVGRRPSSANFLIWWDGDAQRELLDGTVIDKYGPQGDTRLLTGSGVAANNGTKATPALSADILGDWREEVIWRTADNRALRIYSTTEPTDISRPSLMQDRQYRVAVAWQNTAYNQPPHPSFVIE
jgi:rhamnogalacturonan endolyase